MKALGVGLGAFRFHDVEVVRLASGQPALSVTGAAADAGDPPRGGKMAGLAHPHRRRWPRPWSRPCHEPAAGGAGTT